MENKENKENKETETTKFHRKGVKCPECTNNTIALNFFDNTVIAFYPSVFDIELFMIDFCYNCQIFAKTEFKKLSPDFIDRKR